MPRGYRRYILAAFGWLILCAAQVPDNAASDEQPASAANVEQSLNAIASAQNKIAESTNIGENQRSCDKAQHRDLSERCAEWAAADWARDSLLVGALGAIGIIVALLLTIDSNRIARDTARRQLRAYVTYGALHKAEVVSQGQKCWKLQLEWVNRGQTPALKANSYLHGCIRDTRLPADFDFAKPIEEAEEGAAFIGPGRKIYSPCSLLLPMELLPQAADGERFFYLWARVDYKDVFGRDRYSQWAARLAVDRTDDSFGITWRSINRHINMT